MKPTVNTYYNQVTHFSSYQSLKGKRLPEDNGMHDYISACVFADTRCIYYTLIPIFIQYHIYKTCLYYSAVFTFLDALISAITRHALLPSSVSFCCQPRTAKSRSGVISIYKYGRSPSQLNC